MMRYVLCLCLLNCFMFTHAQDFSNKGKDFWIPYPEHIDGASSAMGIYITGNKNATGTITVGANVLSFTLTANTVVRKFIGPNAGGDAPNSFVHMGGIIDGIKVGGGIHVVSNADVVVYAHIIRSARSGATLVLPVKVWGKEYLVPSYKNTGGSVGYGEVNILASVPNTQVEIIPSVNTRNNSHLAGVPFTVTLSNVGDVYQLQFASALDISGTKIRSIASGTTNCNPIAVFSATTWSGFPCNAASGGDNLYQQLFPVSTWGKEFLTSPLKKVATNAADQNKDYIKIFVKDPTTVVNRTRNGITTTLTNLNVTGSYYEDTAYQPELIIADKPIQVVQYISSQTCGSPATNSDPEMIVLNAVEQTIDTITVFSAHQNFVPPNQSQVTNHYLNVITKTTNVPSFTINGALPAASFIPIPGTAYSYLKEDITVRVQTNPVSTLAAAGGFSAIAYGFGNVESYGYNAGTNVRDPYQQIGVSTLYGIETSPSVCEGSPFKYKISLPYRPDSMYWDFHNYPTAAPFPNVMQNSPVPLPYDSSTVVNGKTIYWYSLPNYYSYSPIGTYPVTITTYTANAEGCGNNQEINFDLEVSAFPVANFTWTTPECAAMPVTFHDATVSAKPRYRWWWDFNDPTTGAQNNSLLRDPVHTFSGPGTYHVRFSNITTPGCVSDTITVDVVVPANPSATLTGTTAVCAGAPSPAITFTGSGGVAPYTFSYTLNNGPVQTITTTSGSSVSLNVPTTTAGSYVYTLTNIAGSGSPLCSNAQTGSVTITVNPKPTATIAASATSVCQNSSSPNIVFTGSGGTAPYKFSYTINGGPVQVVNGVSGNTATVPVPTSTPGNFIYSLVSVQDGSATLCSNTQTGSATVNIQALPTATIAGNTAVCVNSPAPLITFAGAGGTAPYIFSYTLNGGPVQTINTVSGNSVTIPVSTTTAGTYIYNLVSVRESGPNQCSQNIGSTATVQVNPLPTGAISGGGTVCQGGSSPVINFTGANGTAPYTFTYKINGGGNLTVTGTGNTATVNAPTTTPGTYTYTLVSVQDASSTVCSQNQGGTVTIIVNPLPQATISGTTAVCLNGTSPLITFTGTGATIVPYTFTYNINGGPNQTISTISGNSITLSAPANQAGVFIYNLVSVRDASAVICSNSVTGSATITVNPLPTATISGNTEACLNTSSPNVTFTGANGTAPYTFSYTINGGPVRMVISSGNTATVPAPTTVAGTFTYALVNVKDASSTLCAQNQSGSVQVIIDPLPVATFATTTPLCATRTVQFSDQSQHNASSITNWQWNFGDPSGSSILQNPAHVFGNTGIFNVSLTVTNDKGCVSIPKVNPITIHALPKAGFVIPEVCLLDPYAQFNDTSRISPPDVLSSWQWTFGDAGSGAANTSIQQHATHTYSAVGPYNVQLIVGTNAGCTDTIRQPLYINSGNPAANFTQDNPSAYCSNDSIRITNTSTIGSGSITKVEIYWDNVNQPGVFQTDDLPVFNKVYAHKYPTSQTTRNYTIRFRAYSGGVCVNDKFSTITVFAAPLVRFNTVPDICYDAPVTQITQATETAGLAGNGVFTGPGVNASGMFDPRIAGIGLHRIRYTFTSTQGGCVDTASQLIRVLDTASSRLTVIQPVCEGNATTFRDASTSPAGISLASNTWNFGDGSPVETHAPGATFTHVYPAPGNYTVTMYATTSTGCKAQATLKTVTVSPAPFALFSLDKTSYCLPDARVGFRNSSTIPDGTGASLTYTWDFGDPATGVMNSSTNVNPSHVFSGNGPFNVKLTVRSGVGCTHDTTIVVNTIHPQPKAEFSSNLVSVCLGQPVSFTDRSDPKDGTTVSWHWNFGDNRTSANQLVPNPEYTYGSAQTYVVKLYTTNSWGCNSDTLAKDFTVYPYPTVNAGLDDYVLDGGSFQMNPTVSGNDLTFLWTPSTFLTNANIRNPISKPLEDTRYLLTVTGRGGCTSTDDIKIMVLKGPAIPNTFSPNNDGINDFWVIRYLDTYPNNRVQVFTRGGQLVFESRGYKKPWNGTANGKSLPVDTYYYIIEPGNGRKSVTGYVTIIK